VPVSKKGRKWTGFIAKEFNIPEASIWITDMHEERTYVYIWVEKLGPGDYERLSSFKSGGGHLSLRGKLARFLDDMNADGYFTKVKPNKAVAQDLHPIIPNTGKPSAWCTLCGTPLRGAAELQLQNCAHCAGTVPTW
jgi:hypothetical protein